MALIEHIDCVSIDSGLGRVVAVESSNATAQLSGPPAPLGHSWVRVTVTRTALIEDDPFELGTGRTSPAPNGVTSLDMLPAWLSVTATCARRQAACVEQKVKAHLPSGMTPEDATQTIVASATRAGFDVDDQSCREITSSTGSPARKCVVTAQRFVLPNGQGRIAVTVFLNGSSDYAVGVVSTP